MQATVGEAPATTIDILWIAWLKKRYVELCALKSSQILTQEWHLETVVLNDENLAAWANVSVGYHSQSVMAELRSLNNKQLQ